MSKIKVQNIPNSQKERPYSEGRCSDGCGGGAAAADGSVGVGGGSDYDGGCGGVMVI